MLDNRQGHVGRSEPEAVNASRAPRAAVLRAARARWWARGIGGHPEFALEDLSTALVLAQRLAAAPGARISAHQRALAKLGERIERHQPATGMNGGIGLAGGVVRRGQALQNVANQRQGAIALSRQPFLKGLRIEIKIGQKLAAVQLRRRLQLGAVERPRQPLKAVQVDHHVVNSTIGKVGDQVARRARPQRLAQLQQTVAQAVARLLGALIRPQQIGKPLTTDRVTALRRQITQQSPRLLGYLPKPAIISLDDQRSKNADRECHRHGRT